VPMQTWERWTEDSKTGRPREKHRRRGRHVRRDLGQRGERFRQRVKNALRPRRLRQGVTEGSEDDDEAPLGADADLGEMDRGQQNGTAEGSLRMLRVRRVRHPVVMTW
jgi:hypothetical protein